MTSVCQATPPNQFELPENRATHPRRLQFVNRSPRSDHWKQAECISYPLVKESFEDQRCKRTIKPASHPSSVQSNQFRGNQTSALPLFLPGSVQDNLSCSRSDLLSRKISAQPRSTQIPVLLSQNRGRITLDIS